MEGDKKYRIIIADRSSIVVEGLSSILGKSSMCTVVSKFYDLESLMDHLPVAHADILIVNPMFVEYSKRDAVRTLFQTDAKCAIVALVYTFVEQSLIRQFHGAIEIDDSVQQIEMCLKNAVSVKNSDNSSNGEDYELSKREIDVLVAVAKGLMNKEIADFLNISIHTVISHRKNISRKTGIKSVSGLTVFALLNNLIDQKDVQ